jgi:predicted LPLAT superfamily acyltransferase/3-hydroxymyristoyl/3-hydroxydecanoyl-(acyl carrier protein) dehydratase
MSVLTTLKIDAGHPALAGHFPGAPVLPGVVLLDETVRALEQASGAAASRWTIGTAKFLKPVRPGETLTLEYEPLPNGSIRFAVSSAGRAVANGVLRPAETARRSARTSAAAGPPGPLAPPSAPASAVAESAGTVAEARTSDAQWAAPERGSATLASIMISVSLLLGRRVARCLLYGIAVYFFVFAPRARRHAREYLRRALGRAPSSRDCFRQIFTFSATILDRLYLARERYELFAITIEGEPLMRSIVSRGNGAFLLGAHLGSFEIMSAMGRRQPGLRVAMAMSEDAASKLNAFAAATHSASAPEIIPLGHLEAMLRIRDCLEAGSFVGMLADRTIGEAAAQRVSFLGRVALFPSGPMRAAAALKRPVFFMTGLYRGANRYHVVLREIADFSAVPRAAREAQVQEAIRRYVALLEEYCRSDPYNWFNFYDFWHGADDDSDGAAA